MKKAFFFLFILLEFCFVSMAQLSRPNVTGTNCTLSVYIDSIVVRPCFLMGGGGSCGCGNTLWAVVSGGTPPYTYLWTPSSVTTDTLYGACYLEFTVEVTDASGCIATDSLNVVIPPHKGSASIDEYDYNSGINLFPVPSVNELNVSITDLSLKAHTAYVYDVFGKKIIEQKINSNAALFIIDTSTFAEGSYFIRIVGFNGQKTLRFTKD